MTTFFEAAESLLGYAFGQGDDSLAEGALGVLPELRKAHLRESKSQLIGAGHVAANKLTTHQLPADGVRRDGESSPESVPAARETAANSVPVLTVGGMDFRPVEAKTVRPGDFIAQGVEAGVDIRVSDPVEWSMALANKWRKIVFVGGVVTLCLATDVLWRHRGS